MSGSRPRPPPADSSTVFLVLAAEGRGERGLFVEHDEQVHEQHKTDGIGSKRRGFVEERCTRERKSRAEIHGVAQVPVRTADNKMPRRVERSRCPAPKEGERRDTPERESRADEHGHASDGLRRAKVTRSLDPGSRQRLPGQINKDHPDKQTGVCHGSDEDAQHRVTYPSLSAPNAHSGGGRLSRQGSRRDANRDRPRHAATATRAENQEGEDSQENQNLHR
jgi:hypothetical protein